MHEPLAEQIYFQTKFKMKFKLPLTTNQETPNTVKAIPRRGRSVKCTLISFNQQKNPEIHPSPFPFFVHLFQLKKSNFNSKFERTHRTRSTFRSNPVRVRKKKTTNHVMNPIVNTDFFFRRAGPTPQAIFKMATISRLILRSSNSFH